MREKLHRLRIAHVLNTANCILLVHKRYLKDLHGQAPGVFAMHIPASNDI